MIEFEKLCIGDVFNSGAGRWVKTSEGYAMSILSGVYPLGRMLYFAKNKEVQLLWSCILKVPE